jgi:gamma-glutamyltranspeptidase/glutathione hydrolase
MTMKVVVIFVFSCLALTSCGGGSEAHPVSAAAPPASAPAPAPDATRFDPALCAPQAGAPHAQTAGIAGTNVMVASADLSASMAGCRVLARGGSAIDAAVAVQAVLGVVEPFASGLAGGALITYYDAQARRVQTFDGLSAAPSMTGGVPSIYVAAVPDDASCKSGLTVGSSSLSIWQGNTNISGRAFGVPGTVKALDLVHRSYGQTPWNQLWDDAISLAEGGFPMTRTMYGSLFNGSPDVDEESGVPTGAGPVPAWVNSAGTARGAARCVYKDIQQRYCDPTDPAGERPLPVGTTITNTALADTMKRVRDGGAAAFYDPNGPIVQAMLQRFRDDKFKADGSNNCFSSYSSSSPVPARIPSLVSAQDFAGYRAIERRPLSATRFGATVYTQSPPSFGGLVVLYNLGLAEAKGVASQGFNDDAFVYTLTEASRLANADRRNLVGDPAYSNVDARVAAALRPGYLTARAALINGTALGSVPAGTQSDGIPAFVAADPSGYSPMAARGRDGSTRFASARGEDWNTTSQLAIVDGYGSVLSMTTTINIHWGAHAEAAGMMLNNALSNFSAGTTGSDVNGYEPNKRPRTAMAPSIALDSGGRVRLAWGAAGGGPIPDYITKAFLGHWVHGMDLQAAIDSDNWTGQSGIAELESGKAIAGRVGALQSQFGHRAQDIGVTTLKSGAAGISIAPVANARATYKGAADNRRNGGGAGY